VDDETAILEITRATLAAYNYHVWASSSGDAAMVLYAQRHAEIDLVITDVLMPGMDGPALMDAMRTINPDVKLIAVSGISSAAKGLGDCAFLKKPYSTTALLKMVRSALDS
jgi:DNA-binding NtrC family response regulator